MRYTVGEIARILGGEVIGDPSLVVTGFSPAATAKPDDLTFAENDHYFSFAEKSAATAILVDGTRTSEAKTLIRVKNARIGFAQTLPLFFPETVYAPGIHPTAVVSSRASVDATAHIGPHCVVADGCTIGARCVLIANNYIGEDARLDEETRLFPSATVYARTQIGKRVRIHAGSVIGSDGYGYVLDAGAHRKVPQVGNVVIGDDVEIGANVTIDRGALGSTVIGRGTKIDNLVQIAHNVVIGEHSLLVAQVGVAGSTRLGNYVTLAGQVGIAGHLKIGDRAIIAAQSGVMNDVPPGTKWFGTPALPDRQMKRQILALGQLPELLRRVRELERRLGIDAAVGDVAQEASAEKR
jgi:UDP-3-O-[3-hydroxymyristoyl] glucosamine N-acyltransferase